MARIGPDDGDTQDTDTTQDTADDGFDGQEQRQADLIDTSDTTEDTDTTDTTEDSGPEFDSRAEFYRSQFGRDSTGDPVATGPPIDTGGPPETSSQQRDEDTPSDSQTGQETPDTPTESDTDTTGEPTTATDPSGGPPGGSETIQDGQPEAAASDPSQTVSRSELSGVNLNEISPEEASQLIGTDATETQFQGELAGQPGLDAQRQATGSPVRPTDPQFAREASVEQLAAAVSNPTIDVGETGEQRLAQQSPVQLRSLGLSGGEIRQISPAIDTSDDLSRTGLFTDRFTESEAAAYLERQEREMQQLRERPSLQEQRQSQETQEQLGELEREAVTAFDEQLPDVDVEPGDVQVSLQDGRASASLRPGIQREIQREQLTDAREQVASEVSATTGVDVTPGEVEFTPTSGPRLEDAAQARVEQAQREQAAANIRAGALSRIGDNPLDVIQGDFGSVVAATEQAQVTAADIQRTDTGFTLDTDVQREIAAAQLGVDPEDIIVDDGQARVTETAQRERAREAYTEAYRQRETLEGLAGLNVAGALDVGQSALETAVGSGAFTALATGQRSEPTTSQRDVSIGNQDAGPDLGPDAGERAVETSFEGVDLGQPPDIEVRTQATRAPTERFENGGGGIPVVAGIGETVSGTVDRVGPEVADFAGDVGSDAIVIGEGFQDPTDISLQTLIGPPGATESAIGSGVATVTGPFGDIAEQARTDVIDPSSNVVEDAVGFSSVVFSQATPYTPAPEGKAAPKDIVRPEEEDVAEGRRGAEAAINVFEGIADVGPMVIGGPETVRTLGDVGSEIPGFVGSNVQEEGVVEGSVESVETGADVAQTIGEQVYEQAKERPGYLGGTLLGTAGGIGLAAKGSSTLGRGTAFAIQPGEEIASAGLTRAFPSIASRIPGGRIDIEEIAIGAPIAGTRKLTRSARKTRDLIRGDLELEPTPRQRSLIEEGRPTGRVEAGAETAPTAGAQSGPLGSRSDEITSYLTSTEVRQPGGQPTGRGTDVEIESATDTETGSELPLEEELAETGGVREYIDRELFGRETTGQRISTQDLPDNIQDFVTSERGQVELAGRQRTQPELEGETESEFDMEDVQKSFVEQRRQARGTYEGVRDPVGEFESRRETAQETEIESESESETELERERATKRFELPDQRQPGDQTDTPGGDIEGPTGQIDLTDTDLPPTAVPDTTPTTTTTTLTTPRLELDQPLPPTEIEINQPTEDYQPPDEPTPDDPTETDGPFEFEFELRPPERPPRRPPGIDFPDIDAERDEDRLFGFGGTGRRYTIDFLDPLSGEERITTENPDDESLF